MQLDMFTPVQISELQLEVAKVKRSSEQVRRGLFARHTALEKFMTELMDKIESQEREIYRLKSKLYDNEPELQLKVM